MFAAFVVVLFATTAYSQFHTQVIRRDDILKSAEKLGRFRVERVDKANRGTVKSSDGAVLAQSEETFVLSLTLAEVPHLAGFYAAMSDASGIPAATIGDAVRRGVPRLVHAEPIGPEQAARIRQVQATWRANGVSLERQTSRTYPLREAASTLIGSLPDGLPSGGLEKVFNETLSGKDGHRKGLVDRSGAFLPLRMEGDSKERVDGKQVVLTIDSELQRDATQALREAVEQNKAQGGAAVVMDPKTGDILAIANWPSFDPAERVITGANQAYSFVYEPGSTFKILTLAKALDAGVTGPDTPVTCPGEISFGRKARVRCDAHHGRRAHGTINPEKAIAKSCNIAAAKWSLAVGRDKMIDYLRALGLLKKTGVGVDQERAGLFNFEESAKIKQTANVGFGQSLNFTPLALANAFSMLANDGVRMQPRLIKSIDGKEQPIKEAGRIVKEETAHEVMKLMESVIESDIGTGAKLRIPGVRLAGKTGTAEKIGKDSGYVSSFVGYVPAESPRAVVLVMVDKPQGGKIYGATVAGPVFRKLAGSLIDHFKIPTDQ